MTYEEATQLQENLNKILEQSEAKNVTYGVYTFWTNLAQKEYNVILYPNKYSESFASATDSGKLSIVRVSLPVQLLGAQTYEDFITNFDDLVNKDEEASNVIKK
jgi:hypothetical protein